VESWNIMIFDGLSYPLQTWYEHITAVLKWAKLVWMEDKVRWLNMGWCNNEVLLWSLSN
jgi:hypothetical protein